MPPIRISQIGIANVVQRRVIQLTINRGIVIGSNRIKIFIIKPYVQTLVATNITRIVYYSKELE